jgi:hypothetical protein
MMSYEFEALGKWQMLLLTESAAFLTGNSRTSIKILPPKKRRTKAKHS